MIFAIASVYNALESACCAFLRLKEKEPRSFFCQCSTSCGDRPVCACAFFSLDTLMASLMSLIIVFTGGSNTPTYECGRRTSFVVLVVFVNDDILIIFIIIFFFFFLPYFSPFLTPTSSWISPARYSSPTLSLASFQRSARSAKPRTSLPLSLSLSSR